MRLQVELVGPDGERKELDETTERTLAVRYMDVVLRNAVPGHVVAQAGCANAGDGSQVPVDKEKEEQAETEKEAENDSGNE